MAHCTGLTDATTLIPSQGLFFSYFSIAGVWLCLHTCAYNEFDGECHYAPNVKQICVLQHILLCDARLA
jgi:hypothetical protein